VVTPKEKRARKQELIFFAAGMFLAAFVNSFGQPVITKQPTNQTARLFADATFRLSATGTVPLSYQWRFNATETLCFAHQESGLRYVTVPVADGASKRALAAGLKSNNQNKSYESSQI
jgi:hypothetical protein